MFGDISEPWLSYVGAVCLADWGPYAQFAEPGFSAAPLINNLMSYATLAQKLTQLCKIGLIRADHIRDVTRVLLRDNSVPAGVLDSFRADDREVVLALIERTLRDLAADENGAQLAAAGRRDGRFDVLPLVDPRHLRWRQTVRDRH